MFYESGKGIKANVLSHTVRHEFSRIVMESLTRMQHTSRQKKWKIVCCLQRLNITANNNNH